MAWGPEGKPVANPVAAEESLTAQPLEPQAQALVAAIRALTPDVLVTYDSDGGYGHPDHVRVYEIVRRALQILEDDEDRPILRGVLRVSLTRMISACRPLFTVTAPPSARQWRRTAPRLRSWTRRL